MDFSGNELHFSAIPSSSLCCSHSLPAASCIFLCELLPRSVFVIFFCNCNAMSFWQCLQSRAPSCCNLDIPTALFGAIDHQWSFAHSFQALTSARSTTETNHKKNSSRRDNTASTRVRARNGSSQHFSTPADVETWHCLSRSQRGSGQLVQAWFVARTCSHEVR